MDIGSRIQSLGRPLQILLVLTAILSISGIVGSIGLVTDGDAFGYSRIALGLLGLAGIVVLLVGSDNGKTGLMVILAWAAIQSVYFASAPDGNYTRQLIDSLMGSSSSTTINGQITEYSAIGINLIGLAMLFFAYSCRSKLPRNQAVEVVT